MIKRRTIIEQNIMEENVPVTQSFEEGDSIIYLEKDTCVSVDLIDAHLRMLNAVKAFLTENRGIERDKFIASLAELEKANES